MNMLTVVPRMAHYGKRTKLLKVSSPSDRSGLLYQDYPRSVGKPDPHKEGTASCGSRRRRGWRPASSTPRSSLRRREVLTDSPNHKGPTSECTSICSTFKAQISVPWLVRLDGDLERDRLSSNPLLWFPRRNSEASGRVRLLRYFVFTYKVPLGLGLLIPVGYADIQNFDCRSWDVAPTHKARPIRFDEANIKRRCHRGNLSRDHNRENDLLPNAGRPVFRERPFA